LAKTEHEATTGGERR